VADAACTGFPAGMPFSSPGLNYPPRMLRHLSDGVSYGPHRSDAVYHLVCVSEQTGDVLVIVWSGPGEIQYIVFGWSAGGSILDEDFASVDPSVILPNQ